MKLEQLETLRVHNNEAISDTFLNNLMQHPTLVEIDAQNTSITESGKTAFQRARANLQLPPCKVNLEPAR